MRSSKLQCRGCGKEYVERFKASEWMFRDVVKPRAAETRTVIEDQGRPESGFEMELSN